MNKESVIIGGGFVAVVGLAGLIVTCHVMSENGSNTRASVNADVAPKRQGFAPPAPLVLPPTPIDAAKILRKSPKQVAGYLGPTEFTGDTLRYQYGGDSIDVGFSGGRAIWYEVKLEGYRREAHTAQVTKWFALDGVKDATLALDGTPRVWDTTAHAKVVGARAKADAADAADERRRVAKEVDGLLIRNRMEGSAEARGKGNTTMRINFVFCGRVLATQILDETTLYPTGLRGLLLENGFTKFECWDGFQTMTTAELK